MRQGDQVAYANGFVDIEAKNPDANQDGLNDLFQRVNFTRWTAPSAGPDHDADGDGFTNAEEYAAGSDPNNPTSTPLTAVPPFSLLSVEVTESGASITFESQSGSNYQLYSRRDLVGDPWIQRGSPVVAQGEVTVITDPDAAGDFKFYRIETVP